MVFVQHEMETGRTSSVSQQIMGFTSTGKVTNHKDMDLDRSLSWGEIVKEAAKVRFNSILIRI